MQARLSKQSRFSVGLALLLVYAAVVGLYWVVRYNGWAIDIDTVRISASAEGTFFEGRLAPTEAAYHAGYGYPALLVFLSHIAGVSIQSIQLNFGLWICIIALVAFICYRELLGESWVALIASMLLLLQPDFSFYVLRGSHEKTTWLFAMLLLFFLSRSYRTRRSVSRLAIFIALFYVAFWAMIANNAYFASTFMTTFAFCFIGGSILTKWRWRSEEQQRASLIDFRRLLLTSFTCFVMVFVFVAYVYEPAVGFFYNLSGLVDRLSALFLGAQPTRLQPYQYVQAAWRARGIYPLLTGTQWSIALGSLVTWLLQGLHLIAGKDRPRSSWQEHLIWLMYTAFGMQLAFGIVADFAGFLSGNLQVRLYVPFALFTSPMAALLIIRIYRKLNARRRRVAIPVAGLMASYAVIAALLKITNDPLVSNQWLFSSPSEFKAGQWTDSHLQYQQIWMGSFSHEDTATRQVDMLGFWNGYDWDTTNIFLWRPEAAASSPYILNSHLTQLQANRSAVSLPGTLDRNRVYDNGDVQVFHRRPKTPYQR